MALNRDKVLREAEKLVQRGKVEQAIREYEKVLKSNPNDANTINRVGDLYGRVGQVDKAIELYERIADYFTQDGFTTKAIAMLKKINRLAPQRLEIFDRLAELYIQQGLKVEAKNQYGMLAEWYIRNGDHENTIRINRKLAEIEPGNHMAQLRLADALMQGGKEDESLAVYDRLGRMLLEHDRLDEAERLYRHVLELNPPRGEFLVPLCRALLGAARMDLAREFVDIAMQLSPGDRDVQELKTQFQLATGDASDALETAKKVYAAEPGNSKNRVLMGQSLLATGETAKAREILIGVLDEALDQGDRPRAQEVVRLLVEAMPRDVDVLERAVQVFAGVAGDDLVTMKRALAHAYDDDGRDEQALAVYEGLAALVPEDETVRVRLNELSAKVGRPRPGPSKPPSAPPVETPMPPAGERTLGVLRAVPSSPDAATEAPRYQPQERLAEANVFAKYGLVDKAIVHLKEIIGQAPELWEAHEKLVALLVEQGREDEAASVAAPLAEHYRQQGNETGLATLRKAVGRIAAPASASGVRPVEPHGTQGAGSDEVVIDIDADLLAEAGIDQVEEHEQVDLEIPVEAGVVAAEVNDGAGRPDATGGAGEAAPAQSEAAADLPEFSFEEAEGDWAAATEVEEATELTFELEAPQAPWESSSKGPKIQSDRVDELEASFPPPGKPSPAPADDTWSAEPSVTQPAVVPAGNESAVEFTLPTSGDEEEMVEMTSAVSGPPPAELEQVDFFIAQELYDDAVRMVTRLEADYPDDGEVAERRLVLKSKGVVLEELAPATPGEQPEDLFAEEEEYIDLAKELEAELAEEEAMVDEATGRGKDEALLEEVFREFQKGVSQQLSEEDSDTHFNLGIAYKEMGLLAEAIGEFQISSRDPAYFLESCSMIGMCYLEQGLPEQGAQWYRKAMEAPDLGEDGRRALQYDLAVSLEFSGDIEQAVSLYEEIAAAVPGYRDVASRLVELQRQRHVN